MEDSSGKVLPDLTVEDYGRIEWSNPSFFRRKYIAPLGFRSKRAYFSDTDGINKIFYRAEVLEKNNGAWFRVTALDDQGHLTERVYEGERPSQPWQMVVDKIREAQPLKRKKNTISGPVYFGFADVKVRRNIEQMENAWRCVGYSPLSNDLRVQMTNRGTLMNDIGEIVLPSKTLPDSEAIELGAVTVGDGNEDVCSVCHDGGELVACDYCPRAFHPSCIGIMSEELYSATTSWACENCLALDWLTDHSRYSEEEDAMWQELASIFLGIVNNAHSHFLIPPIDLNAYPDYLQVVGEKVTPICLSHIRDRVYDRCYLVPFEFYRDMQAVFENCIRYNSDRERNIELATVAEHLKSHFERLFTASLVE